MKVSLKWLNSLIDLEGLSPEEIAKKLTFAGVEVESIDKAATASNLVIGQIVSCEKHPDSEHLHVLQVNEGSKYGLHQIVCGAPNARKGLKVIVAREGAVLPEVTIAKSTIRGIDSDGMCCALYELGVDKKYLSEKQCSGIEELDEEAEIGNEDVLGYLGLDDTVLDLSLLANRSDLLSMENVAREVSALFHRETKIGDVPSFKEVPTSFEVTSSTEKCKIFAARLVKGIKVGPSPKWLSSILRSEGVRSINNVVDIGNYLMLLTGQPLNMYDYDKLPEAKLEVTSSYKGAFKAMDENDYELVEGDLLVNSASRPMCLAGIMTSLDASVTENSKNIVIEAALFDGASIRHTSNRLGLASESSGRFTKGINPEGQSRVLSLAASMLKELAGAEVIEAEARFDSYPHKEKAIKTNLSYINGRLGTSLSYKEVKDVLEDDNMKIEELGNESFIVHVPSYRIDMGEAADVSEEVIRLLGYDKVPASLFTSGEVFQGRSEEQEKRLSIRHFLRDQGLSEVLTYTLVDKAMASSFNHLGSNDAYVLQNPITEDHAYVRTSIIPSLIQVASYNISRQIPDVEIFEVSDIDAKGEKGLRLAGILTGKEEIQGSLNGRLFDFYSAKGLIEGIFDILHISHSRYKFEKMGEESKDEFHPGKSAFILSGKNRLGVLGEIHPTALKKYGLGKNAVAFELDLGAILSIKTGNVKAVVPSKFPFMSRDLAFTISKKVNYEDVKREIERSDKLIKGVAIFDLYEGGVVKEGEKSMALSIRFGSEERTLKEAEVSAVMEKVISMLRMRFLAEVRA